MAQFRFVVDGDFVDFYDGSQHVFRVRNTTQDVDWYYETAPGINFEVDGHKYFTVPSQIEIDGVVLSANTDFDAAIAAIFPNLTGAGEGGITTVGSVGAGDAKGASISGSTIFMHKATQTQPGLVGVDVNQTFGGNKSFNGSVQFQNLTTFESIIKIIHSAAPSAPAAGYVNLYAKTDKKLYIKNSDGTETELGAGGTTLYTGDGTLSGNRVVTLGANSLSFIGLDGSALVATMGNQQNLLIGLGESFIKSFNATGDGNESIIQAVSEIAETAIHLIANFNDGVKQARIDGFADATTSILTHSADEHIFNGNFKSGTNNEWDLDGHTFEFEGGNVYSDIGANFLFYIQNGDNNYLGYFSAHSSLIRASFQPLVGDLNAASVEVSADEEESMFVLRALFNQGASEAKIEAIARDAETSLTFDANTYQFNGVLEFADNAAALVGGLEEGQLYRTGDVLKIVHD